jgi:hypothetical protein
MSETDASCAIEATQDHNFLTLLSQNGYGKQENHLGIVSTPSCDGIP